MFPSTTALAVYDEFESAEALANMDLHELTDFIIEKERIAFLILMQPKPFRKLPAVLPFTKTVNDSVNQVLSISITSMKALNPQIKEFDKAIIALMELFLPNVLISIPGITCIFSRYHG